MALFQSKTAWLTLSLLAGGACSSTGGHRDDEVAGTSAVTSDSSTGGTTDGNPGGAGMTGGSGGSTGGDLASVGGNVEETVGGSRTGGEPTVGGANSGGAGLGGATSGGTAAGGEPTGGNPSAGTAGVSSTGAGGTAAGGAAAGGTTTGGTTGVGGAGGTGGASTAIGDGAITIDGRQILVDSLPIHLQGVCWNPVPQGGDHPADLDYAGFVSVDAPLMTEAGINVVRTYEPIADPAVLDVLHEAGIKVLMSVYVWGGDDPDVSTDRVNAIKDHPAVLMWLVGNEWNYNGLYVDLSFEESQARVQAAATLVRTADPTRPVATIYGEIPSADTVNALSAVDVWGINTYRGISFGSLFDEWAAVGAKPMFLAEWGADAYDARDGGAPNLDAQAEATGALAAEIASNAAANGGVCSGGTLFEWADEWWKDSAGDPNVHDIGGIAPGGGPYPDQTFNEEWWGIVTIDREPRPAYDALRSVYARGFPSP